MNRRGCLSGYSRQGQNRNETGELPTVHTDGSSENEQEPARLNAGNRVPGADYKLITCEPASRKAPVP